LRAGCAFREIRARSRARRDARARAPAPNDPSPCHRAPPKHQFAVVVPFRQQVGKAAPIALFVYRDARIVAAGRAAGARAGPALPRHQVPRKSHAELLASSTTTRPGGKARPQSFASRRWWTPRRRARRPSRLRHTAAAAPRENRIAERGHRSLD
jgi:hypothetical protein